MLPYPAEFRTIHTGMQFWRGGVRRRMVCLPECLFYKYEQNRQATPILVPRSFILLKRTPLSWNLEELSEKIKDN